MHKSFNTYLTFRISVGSPSSPLEVFFLFLSPTLLCLALLCMHHRLGSVKFHAHFQWFFPCLLVSTSTTECNQIAYDLRCFTHLLLIKDEWCMPEDEEDFVSLHPMYVTFFVSLRDNWGCRWFLVPSVEVIQFFLFQAWRLYNYRKQPFFQSANWDAMGS